MAALSRRSFIPMLGTAILGASCLSFENQSTDEPTNIILPQRLKKGDTIGVCAPAGAMGNPKDIVEFKLKLQKLGLKIKVGPNVEERYGYFSANDTDRAKEFMDFVSDDEVQGIFFIRGGWGCARILEHLDFDIIQNNPKVIMGFSDITTLLNAITAKTGLVTFHGPGGNSTWNEYSLRYIEDLLFNGELVKYQNTPEDHKIITYSSGISNGELYGGNLSVLTSLIGSDYLPDWKGKILFLEDVMEEPYRIDRMLTQLQLSGILDQVDGIVLGNFRKCTAEEPHKSFTLEEVFSQHFKNFRKPVYFGAQIGHIRNKFTTPVGTKVEINADLGTITLLQTSVA
ncbi:MAG: S66 peptidase family protein [Crocinitomicaceae bacterium]